MEDGLKLRPRSAVLIVSEDADGLADLTASVRWLYGAKSHSVGEAYLAEEAGVPLHCAVLAVETPVPGRTLRSHLA